MKNPNPFIPEGSFLEQKNKARARLRIAVFFSISLSVMVLMALLIQGCRKNDTGQEEAANTSNPPPELPTNPPESNPTATAPPTETAPTPPPAVTPPPVAPPPAAPPVAEGQEYTVVKGDTFATIAKKSGVSVKALETANPGVDAKKLQIGQKLHVPAPTSATTAAPMAAPGAPEMASAGGEQTYKVKSGDTLIGIAKQFHTTVKAIESANNLTSTSIKVGQVLKIPVKAAPAPEPAPAPETAAPPATLPPATATNH